MKNITGNDITGGDPKFFVRSNAHVDLSNAQVLEDGGRVNGVADSMIYAAARFAAYFVRRSCKTREEMTTQMAAHSWRLTELFRECLETNMRENLERFDEK